MGNLPLFFGLYFLPDVSFACSLLFTFFEFSIVFSCRTPVEQIEIMHPLDSSAQMPNCSYTV